MILLGHPYFLRDDAKQLARMKPYPPVAGLADLAMLFQGTYTTPFDRRLRDALHADVRGAADDVWFELGEAEASHLSHRPTEIADAAR